MSATLELSKKFTEITEGRTQLEKICKWLVKRKGEVLLKETIAKEMLDVFGRDLIRVYQFSGYVSKCRFILEQEYGCTLVYQVGRGYKVAPKGSKEGSRFTIQHYRRAVLMASRARELDELGFLNPDHVDELIEEVMLKASRKVKDVASLREILVERWKALRSKERRIETDKAKKGLLK